MEVVEYLWLLVQEVVPYEVVEFEVEVNVVLSVVELNGLRYLRIAARMPDVVNS